MTMLMGFVGDVFKKESTSDEKNKYVNTTYVKKASSKTNTSIDANPKTEPKKENIMENKEKLNKVNQLKAATDMLYAQGFITRAACDQIGENISALVHDLNSENSSVYRITCAGIYNSGKSTLLNILTGGNHFAVGDVPTTSTIDEFSYDNCVYVDTPGLNANDLDTETARKAFKEADIILFVSNIVSGGLTSSEADYLKQLSEILGGNENLQKQTIFAMSNLHQVEETSVNAVVTEHKNNIESVMGFKPDVIVYDAETYSNGVENKFDELIADSGINDLKKAITQTVENISGNSKEIRSTRIETKWNALANAVDAAIEPLVTKLKKLNDLQARTKLDPKQVETAKAKCKSILENAKDNMKRPQFSCEKISASDLLSKSTYLSNYKSKSEIKRKIKELVQRAYDHRKSALRSCADKFCDNLNSLINNGELCNSVKEAYNNAVQECNELLKKCGVVLSVDLIKPLDILQPALVYDSYAVKGEVCEDVIEYDGYYTVSQYIDMYCDDISDLELYDHDNIFGKSVYKHEYSCSCRECIYEMAKDMNGTYTINCQNVWNRYFPDTNSADDPPKNYSEFINAAKAKTDAIQQKIAAEAEAAVKSTVGNIKKDIEVLENAINSVKQFFN